MKVLSLLVGTAARTGGPPAFVGESALELERAGHAMTILSTDLALAPTGWIQRQQRVVTEHVHPSLRTASTRIYPARFPRRLAYSPELGRAARAQASVHDVVHLHNLWQYPQYAGFRAAERAGVPYIVSPHGSLDPYLRRHGRARKAMFTALYQRRMFERAALIHVTTAAEAELIADIAPDVPRAIVPCGVYVDAFSELPPRERFRDEFLHGYTGPVIVFIGRITFKKGVDVLIRAFAHLRRGRDARLVIVGPDDEGRQAGLEALAADLGVGDHVHFVGPLYDEHRLAALASADVWALSSHTENFGIAVIEAMAAGRAVCISPAVNLAPDIAAAEAGIVAPVEPARFGDAMASLIAGDGHRERIEARAVEFAARYDWRAITPRLVEMYERAVATRPGRPRSAAAPPAPLRAPR